MARTDSGFRNDTSFEPDAARAARFDARMRERLADSLAYIAETAGENLGAARGGMESFIAGVRRGPVDPLAFGCYFELVLAIENDDWDEAARTCDMLLGLPQAGPGIEVRPLPDDGDRAARYRRLVNTGDSVAFDLLPPPPETAGDFSRLIDEGFALVRRGYPEQAAETEALLREIILAVGPPDKDAWEFDGASSFMFWGGIFLNAENRLSRLGMAKALIHETAHNLLFGLAADGPMVLNDDEARYASPLREDPRPMDGIFHATFVCARMHNLVRGLQAGGALAAEDAKEAARSLETNAELFRAGYEVIEAHGELTPLGRAVMAGAAQYMEENG